VTGSKQPLATLKGIGLLILVAAGVGYAVNALRPDRVPWVYHRPATPAPTAESAMTEPGWITLEELRAAPPESLLFVDARGPLFFKRSHIPGAISIAKQYLARDLPAAAPVLRKSGEKRVVIYCAAEDCEDSLIVGRELIQFGMKRVFVFKGGWKAWQAAKLPEEKS